MRWPVVLLLLVLAFGCDRAAPPLAGEPERMGAEGARFTLRPEGTTRFESTPPAPPPLHPVVRAPHQIELATNPSNRLAEGDGVSCTVRFFENGTAVWSASLAPCGGRLEVVLAADSSVCARSGLRLACFEPSGAPRWQVQLRGEGDFVHALAAMADSRLAAAISAREVALFELDGREAWRIRLPGDEVLSALRAIPSGLMLATNAALYFVDLDGRIQARQPFTTGAP